MIFRAHDLRRDGLPGRVVHDRAQSEDEGEQQQHPRRDVVVEREHAQHSGGYHHPALGDEQKSPPVDQVRQSARGQDHQKYGKRSGGGDQADHQRRHGELSHQPARADVLHPGAGVGDDGGDPERAEERLAQRGPG